MMNNFYVETEPVYGICIKPIGEEPIFYKNKKLIDAAYILEKWCMHWILTPVKDCKLSSEVWHFTAKERYSNGDSWPEYKEIVLDELRTM